MPCRGALFCWYVYVLRVGLYDAIATLAAL